MADKIFDPSDEERIQTIMWCRDAIIMGPPAVGDRRTVSTEHYDVTIHFKKKKL